MATIQQQTCDLCGGTILPNDRPATLSVPIDPADSRSVSAPPPKSLSDFSALMGFASLFSEGRSAKSFDVCRGCAEGLVKAAAWLRALHS